MVSVDSSTDDFLPNVCNNLRLLTNDNQATLLSADIFGTGISKYYLLVWYKRGGGETYLLLVTVDKSSDCDLGQREILDNGKYELVCTCSEWEYLETEPLTDAEQDMMDKILLLLADEELRAEYTLKGLERVKEFDTSKSMEKYGELFQKVIKP